MSEIIITSGVTSTGIVAESGDVIIIEAGGALVDGIVRNGGALRGTYGAVVTNLTADTGAVVELSEGAKTSGLMLTGGNTNIAEGTLYYMGNAVTGTVVNGMLSNLNGTYRIPVGDGITATNPTVGGEAVVGVRLYANETAVVSGGSVTTSGNIGLIGNAYGNTVTVGGAGVTKATYNLFDNATADNSIVNAGGTLRLNSTGNTVNDTTVNSGGILNFTAGTGNGVTLSGGTALIAGGATVNGLEAHAFTADEITSFYVSNATVIGGSACGTDAGEVDGNVVGTGVLSNYVLTTDQTAFAKNNRTWVWVGGANMAGGGLAKDVTVNNRARLQVQGVGASAANIDVVSGGSLWIFNSARVNDVLVSGLLGTVSAQIVAGYADLPYGRGVVVERATVNSGGSFEVSKGASVEDVTVLSTGRMNVRSGGYVSNATVSANGRLDVYNGASLDKATVKDGGFLVAWTGTIRDVQVSGLNGATKARLSALINGTVENVDVYNGGLVEVGGDGAASANDVRVRSGGVFSLCKGTATNAVVYSSGYLYAENGTTINGVTQSGGTMWISGGATANDMVIKGGAANGDTVFYLSGGAAVGGSAAGNDTGDVVGQVVGTGVLSNYVITTEQSVFNKNNRTWIYVGGNTMTGGGLAKNVTVNNMGRLQVQGVGASAADTSVVSGGSMWIYNNAVVTDTLVSGAIGTRKAQVEAGYNDNTYGKNITVRRITVDQDGLFNVSKGATGYDAVIRNGGTMNIYAGGVVSGANVSKGGAVNINASGAMYLSGTNVASNIKVLTSGALLVSSGAVARDVAVSGTVAGNGNSPFWSLDVKGGAVDGGSAIGYNNVIYGVFLRAIDGGKISDFTITANGAAGDARVWAMIGFNNCVAGSGANLTVESRARLDARNGGVISGATIRNGGYAVAWGGKITDAVVSGAGAGAGARLSAASMGTSIGSIERAAIYGGGYLEAGASAWVDTVDIYSGGSMKLVNDYASAADITVHSGGLLWTYVNGAINNLTVSAGGTWNCDWNAYAAAITGTVTLDLTGAAGLATAMAARHFNGAGDVRVVKASEIVGNYSYQLLASGGHQVNLFTLAIGGGNDYETRNGTADIIDPFRKMSYSRVSSGYDVSGTTVYDLKLVTAVDPSRQIAAVDVAAALATSGSTLNGSDREARWTQNTTYGDTVYAAQGMTTGNAWLEIDGATVGTALYGAAAGQNFTGAVNMKLTSGSIRNLAAGAANGGTVANVNFTMAGGTLAGAAYAGGFGNVTETIKTTITDGTLAEGKDFYAGALANYAKTNTATSVGNISLTIAGGTFGGNIYGASAVKASVANAHTAGNVTLSITGGETAKGDQACIFAGGYATGDATATKVYTVGDIDATVSGGSWGEAGNGRGFFGGAFASGVTAEAQDVTITIDGGSIGNVFGGGWAQKGGTSIVDDIEIVITGGTVTNVFGGGAHSTSGGATTVDDVEITISGGSITGSIYAMGQSDGDAVVGDEVSVTFTGANDFGCNVYGYSYVGGEVNDATLNYTDYNGTFSGEIGGFASITLDGGTAMTIATDAGNVSNGAWEFDFTDRASSLAGTSLLTWSTADFENDTIKVRFADETQAKAGWNIATVAEAFSGTTFDLTVGEMEITGLAYNQQIASGDYAGWGFDLESGVLKFKQLA